MPSSRKKKFPIRCLWSGDKPHMIRYHDRERGRPVHSDRRLFEMLILEGAQAGLTWDTILRRREGYRTAFADFGLLSTLSGNPVCSARARCRCGPRIA
ncbi:MAG: hypothetical protein HP497_07345 [Nitrospira sp.]|nr:hypothetical protein [Nitrospira sp.]